MNKFFHPLGKKCKFLDEAESFHCAQVFKQKEGDTILLINGKGEKHIAEITLLEKKKVHFKIIETTTHEYSKVYLYFGIIKSSERMEWLVEKATEIGVYKIIPFISEQAERSKININKLEKVAITALKQSGNPCLPMIEEPQKLKSILISKDISENKFITLLTEKNQFFKNETKLEFKNEIHILIGPEGDFSKTEIELALENKWKPVSLSHHVLRSETAALSALIQVQTIFL